MLNINPTTTETQLIKFAKRTGASLPEIGIHHKKVYKVLHELGGKIYVANFFGNLVWLDKSAFTLTEQKPSKQEKRPEPIRHRIYFPDAESKKPAHDRPVTAPKKLSIFERDGFLCYYCLYKGTAKDLTVDHQIPKSKGGGSDASNLVTCCLPCNRAKSDLTEDEFWAVLKREKATHLPRFLTAH